MVESEGQSGRSPDLAALGILALVVGVFFAPVLFLGRWAPAGGGDLAAFILPYTAYATSSLHAGHVPLWNPYLYSGAPFLADIQSAVFYPLNLPFALAPGAVTYRALEMLSVFHFWLAGALMYACLRAWQTPPLARPAALLGGIAFGLSDLFFTHFGNLNLIAGAAWLPLVMLGVRRGGARGLLLGAVGVALSGLAGHTQPLLHILLAVAVYGAVRLAGTLVEWVRATTAGARTARTEGETAPGGLARLGEWLPAVVGAPVLGLALAALTLLPAYELTSYTRRAGLTYADATAYSLPPQALVGLVAPNLQGRGPAGFWGSWDRVEVGFLGVIPLLLAAVGLTRGRRAVFWAALAGLALLLALGPATPLHELFFRFVPGMAQLRAPARLILLVDFGLAGLAALGLDALLHRPRPIHGWLALATAVALGIGVALAWSRLDSFGRPSAAQLATARNAVLSAETLLVLGAALIALRAWRRLPPRWLALGLPALLVVDLLAQGMGVDTSPTDPTANYDHPAAVAFLQADPSLYRIEVRGESWGVWAPNLSLREGLYDTSGLYNPLEIADYQLFWESLTDRQTRLFDFLNAKYVVGPKDFALPWGKFAPVFDGDPAVNIYLNTQTLPRAQLVYRSRVIPDRRAQFEALRAPGFDPSQSVILESGVALDGGPAGESSLSLAEYEADRLAVDVVAAGEGYVVFSEVYYPGWQAWVDGVAAPIERANFTFRAVRVPRGPHRVELRFEPTTWRVGLAISALAIVAALSLTYQARRRA